MIKSVTMYSVFCDRCGKAFIDEFNGIENEVHDNLESPIWGCDFSVKEM